MRSIEALRDDYERDGYITENDVFTAAELAELRGALDEVIERYKDSPERRRYFAMAPGPDGEEELIKGVFNPNAIHPVFERWMSHPKILDVVEALIGPNIELHHVKFNLKPKGTSGRYGWHQDWPFLPHTTFDVCAVMVFLDDATEETGCLNVLPGSHKLGPRPHVPTGSSDLDLVDPNDPVYPDLQDPAKRRAAPVLAGGIEVHHCCTLHMSEPAKIEAPRTAYIVQYRAADARQIDGMTEGLADYGRLLRGVKPATVRMVEGCFPVPGSIEPDRSKQAA